MKKKTTQKILKKGTRRLKRPIHCPVMEESRQCPKPYEVMYLIFDFFKDFFNANSLKHFGPVATKVTVLSLI